MHAHDASVVVLLHHSRPLQSLPSVLGSDVLLAAIHTYIMEPQPACVTCVLSPPLQWWNAVSPKTTVPELRSWKGSLRYCIPPRCGRDALVSLSPYSGSLAPSSAGAINYNNVRQTTVAGAQCARR
ncbi:unnamed protein product [Arctogadus glacialis]